MEQKLNTNFIAPVRIDLMDLPENSKVRLLGTWALDQDDLKNTKKLQILQYHYDDYNFLYEDFVYIRELYKIILPIVGKLISSNNSLKWDIRSFKVFYGAWLHEYLPVIKDRYTSIESALNQNLNSRFILTNNLVIISSAHDFKQKISDDPYNHFLYTKIVNFLDKEVYNNALFLNKESVNEKKISTLEKIKNSVKKSFLQNIQNLINVCTSKSIAAIDRSYFSYKNFLQFVFNTFPVITPVISFPEVLYKDIKIDLPLRDMLTKQLQKEFIPKNKFEKFISQNLIKDMPYDFIEGFELVNDASSYIDIRNKNFLSTNAILSNNVLQCAVANQLHKDSKLIISQHGGSYGIVRWSMQEFYELDMADKFISFGWSRLDYSHIQKISHPKLLKNFKKNKVTNNKILYISWGPSRFFNRSWSNPIAGKSINNYYSNMLIFLRNFDTSIGKIYIRLSPSNYEYKIGIEKFFGPTFNYADGDFYDEIQSASLVVCDHNQTTFLESLTNNKPTIIVWNTDYTKITDTALLYFDELRSAGIFFNSHIEASNYLNDIIAYSSIDDWWMDSSRQVVVRSFVENFAKRNVNWIEDYKKLLSI